MSAVVARRRADLLIDSLAPDGAPVDVRRVARHLGARILEECLGDVSGMLVSRPGSPPCIIVNKTHAEVRKRFTIAHELGHLYLRHETQGQAHVHVDRGNFISFRNHRSEAGTDAIEIEANQFAAVLLMPTALVRIEADKLGTRRLMDSQVEELAQSFLVSQQAMTIRLHALGLL
jgi:Zn-dependent peptidase ImmA (M78 family)